MQKSASPPKQLAMHVAKMAVYQMCLNHNTKNRIFYAMCNSSTSMFEWVFFVRIMLSLSGFFLAIFTIFIDMVMNNLTALVQTRKMCMQSIELHPVESRRLIDSRRYDCYLKRHEMAIFFVCAVNYGIIAWIFGLNGLKAQAYLTWLHTKKPTESRPPVAMTTFGCL